MIQMNLKKLHIEVKNCLKHIDNYSLNHVYRKNNKVADRLANEAFDL